MQQLHQVNYKVHKLLIILVLIKLKSLNLHFKLKLINMVLFQIFNKDKFNLSMMKKVNKLKQIHNNLIDLMIN